MPVDLTGDVLKMDVMNDLTIAKTAERVLVIGGTSGIGRATVDLLLGRGAEVIAAGRNADRLAQLEAELSGARLLTRVLDARDLEAVSALVGELHGAAPLTGLVNLAGAIALKPAHRTSPADWANMVAQNLTTAFATVRAAGAHMASNPSAGPTRPASVVLVGTAAARIGLPNHEAIAATKAGIEGLVLSAAATYARRNLRFNAVAPGLTRTPLAGPLATDPKMVEAGLKQHPVGRLGEPGDIARAIVWLLDPDNSWVTGQVLAIDGGLSTLKVPA